VYTTLRATLLSVQCWNSVMFLPDALLSKACDYHGVKQSRHKSVSRWQQRLF